MYVKKGIPFNIQEPMWAYTKNTQISFSDVTAIDIFMEVLLNKNMEVIKGFENEKTSRELAESGVRIITAQNGVINFDNFDNIMNVYLSILTGLHKESYVVECKHVGVEFVDSDDTPHNFTFIKVVTQEDIIDDDSTYQVHYLLPLYIAEVEYSKNLQIMLYLSGNGELKFARIPTIDTGSDGYVVDTRALINLLNESKAYGLYAMDKLPHDKLYAIPVDEFKIQLTRCEVDGILRTKSFIPASGLGIYLDADNKTMYANPISNRSYVGSLSIEHVLETTGLYLLMYDNRLYADKIFSAFPISVQPLGNGELMYGGVYLDDGFRDMSDLRAKYAEADTSSGVGRAVEKTKRIPRLMLEKADKFITSIRRCIVEFRKSSDEKLRERVINDEFIPLLDNSLKWILGGASAFGIYFLVVANPIIAALGGFIVKEMKSLHDSHVREKVLKVIKDEIEIVDEKIADAKSRDDRKEKYTLMRIKQSLEGKLMGVTKKRQLVN